MKNINLEEKNKNICYESIFIYKLLFQLFKSFEIKLQIIFTLLHSL